jgi:Fe-S-cluster containining protein
MHIPDQLKNRVIQLFERMDKAYDAVARQSGFACNGCEDNCCSTRFFHHTVLEYLLLNEGMAHLSPYHVEAAKHRALDVVRQMTELGQSHITVRVMCPLNESGRCILYAYRPMICRLHGLAHLTRRPDGQVVTGPGCDDYYAQCGETAAVRLDRTPHYVEMAEMEQTLRRELRFGGKFRMTIAEMLLKAV